jgi:hypothetical protein
MHTEVKAHLLRNYKLDGWTDQIKGQWHYRDLVADDNWRLGWISFDALAFNPDDNRIYCGLNSIDGDLLYSFVPNTEKFIGHKTQRWADAFDSKIHRTLLHNPNDHCLYFATSLLHDVDQQRNAPGGKIVRYDIAADRYDILGIPVDMLYIQSIAADFDRGLIYGYTYPAESLFQFEIKTGRSEILAYTGNAILFSQPHNSVVDKNGWLWGTYAETRAWDETPSRVPIRLFKYHPEGKRFEWFDYGLPRKNDTAQLLSDPSKPQAVRSALSETRHSEDYGFIDAMVYDGDRYIYVGTVAGVLARIDTHTNSVEKIANVMATGRFPALTIASDGILYGAGGMKGQTQVIRWDPQNNHIDGYFNLRDKTLDTGPARIHDIAVDRKNCLYLAENDHHERSSYLWTLELPY